MARKPTYEISLYNSRKKKWEYETTTGSLVQARKIAKMRGKMYGKRSLITKTQVIQVYDKTGKIVS